VKIRIISVPATNRFPLPHYVCADDLGAPRRHKPYVGFDGFSSDSAPLVFPLLKDAVSYVKKQGDIPYRLEEDIYNERRLHRKM
jgi:hypothetical protein